MKTGDRGQKTEGRCDIAKDFGFRIVELIQIS